MNGQQKEDCEVSDRTSRHIEGLVKATFENLPADSRVLIALFVALNGASSVTTRFDLPDQLWEIVRFGNGSPLIGQSEEVNWLKGLCDGILLMADYT